jgi:CheY-like chemotaxis protein
MAPLTARDDIKKKVSEILKRVDRLIRAGEIDQAMREIIHAKEIDPKNVYIFAYEERLEYLKVEHERHKEEEKTRKQAEEAARKRMEEAQEQLEQAPREKGLPQQFVPTARPPQPTGVERQQPRQTVISQKPQKEPYKGVPPKKEPGKEEGQTLEQLEAELRAAEDELKRQAERTKLESLAPHEDTLVKYKVELVKAWADGAVTPLEENQLKELRFNYSITLEEHTRLTKEAQRESFMAAFRQARASGSITPERAPELADLRKRFRISAEEFARMEAEILWQTRAGLQPPVIVLIDDDVQLLNIVTDTLRESGYDVKPYTTSDDAYQYLKSETPDLILSDINLETSTMGGFTFYEKVRELEYLRDVPFIFLSGLADEILIRTGKELGVDDYLTKPFSDETLLATIKGKLKRFKQLRQSRKMNNSSSRKG